MLLAVPRKPSRPTVTAICMCSMRLFASSVEARPPRMARITPTAQGMSAVGACRGEETNPTRPRRMRTRPNIMVSFAMGSGYREKGIREQGSGPTQANTGLEWDTVGRVEGGENFAGDGLGRLGRIDAEGVGGHLEGVELALKKAGIHIVAGALVHAGFERGHGSLKKNKAPGAGRQIFLEQVTIRLLEGGAGEDSAGTVAMPAEKNVVQAVEPGDAVLVSERNAGMHFLPIGFAVVAIAFGEGPAGELYQFCSNGGFSGAGDSHQDNDHACGFPCGGGWSNCFTSS